MTPAEKIAISQRLITKNRILRLARTTNEQSCGKGRLIANLLHLAEINGASDSQLSWAIGSTPRKNRVGFKRMLMQG